MKRSIAGILVIMAITLCSAVSYASHGSSPPQKAPTTWVIPFTDVVNQDMQATNVASVSAVVKATRASTWISIKATSACTSHSSLEYSPPERIDWGCSLDSYGNYKNTSLAIRKLPSCNFSTARIPVLDRWHNKKARDLCICENSRKLSDLKFNRLRNSK